MERQDALFNDYRNERDEAAEAVAAMAEEDQDMDLMAGRKITEFRTGYSDR